MKIIFTEVKLVFCLLAPFWNQKFQKLQRKTAEKSEKNFEIVFWLFFLFFWSFFYKNWGPFCLFFYDCWIYSALVFRLDSFITPRSKKTTLNWKKIWWDFSMLLAQKPAKFDFLSKIRYHKNIGNSRAIYHIHSWFEHQKILKWFSQYREEPVRNLWPIFEQIKWTSMFILFHNQNYLSQTIIPMFSGGSKVFSREGAFSKYFKNFVDLFFRSTKLMPWALPNYY